MTRARWRLAGLLLLGWMAGCSAVRSGWCQVDTCDPLDCASWRCQTLGVPGTYEVRCGADGGTGCDCVHDGVVGKTLSAQHWTTEDCEERIDDANAQCGWSMSTCGI